VLLRTGPVLRGILVQALTVGRRATGSLVEGIGDRVVRAGRCVFGFCGVPVALGREVGGTFDGPPGAAECLLAGRKTSGQLRSPGTCLPGT